MPTQNKIPFELLAPYNESVALVGSWDNWQPIAMQRGDDGVWRTDVSLADGDYQYKFEVISKSYFAAGQKVTVADPKAIQFTLDSRENSIVRIRGGQRIVSEYAWKHDNVPLPSNEQLVIYELHVADFRGGDGDTQQEPGTFAALIEKLDYLADLGINAIELMPVNEFPGQHSWGYAQRSIYAVENSYGSPDDLCRLVDECHARGIRVIHDAVYNHMEREAPLTKIDYSYWYYEHNPDAGELQFGPKFNYEHFDDNLKRFPARDHVMGAMKMWIREFHMDGICFDCTRAIKYFDLLDWLNDEAHREENFSRSTLSRSISRRTRRLRAGRPDGCGVARKFLPPAKRHDAGDCLWGPRPFNTDEMLRLMDGRKDGFISPYNTIHYLGNHDEERTMFLLGDVANTFEEGAFRRLKLGATLLLTAAGCRMLWMGEEFGQATNKSLDPRPLSWGLLNSAHNQGLFNH
ncbi:MAG: alpha-amylase family glycosyl hydrolase [Anaerolineae bacterium]